MSNKLSLLFLVLILMACAPTEEEEAIPMGEPAAATIYRNGAIYTVNPEKPWVDAVAVQDGVIVAAGTEEDAFAAADDGATVIDLEGKMMLPGFQDVHLHVIEAGMNENLCFFEPERTATQYFNALVDCATTLQPGSDWIRGAGVNMAALLDSADFDDTYRPIDLLDEAVPDRPVLILDDLGHGAWANTLAMEAAGFDQLTGNPQGGILVRGSDGRLSGIVLENAQQPLRTASFAPTEANLQTAYDGLLLALDTLAQNGITSVSDAGGYWTRGHHQVWERAVNENTLTVRASNALYVFPDLPLEAQLADLIALYDNSAGLLRFDQAKIYVDGILSQGTGHLLAPYNGIFGMPGVADDGFPYFDTAALDQVVTELDAAGFQLHFHATGDRGTRVALDAIEQATAANGDDDKRHRLTHVYLVHPDDRGRFAELNVIADFQLAPSSIDAAYRQDIQWLIGEREGELLPAFQLYDAGATITISSDWDADALSPFVKMESLLEQRGAPSSETSETMKTIIEWMTINPAYLLHQDDTTGTIEVGKQADLVVVDQNLFEIPPAQLSNTNVLLTMLAGEEVYRAADAPAAVPLTVSIKGINASTDQ